MEDVHILSVELKDSVKGQKAWAQIETELRSLSKEIENIDTGFPLVG